VASVGGEFGFGGVLRDAVGERGDGAFVAQHALDVWVSPDDCKV
jgi:hypothetical protein